MSQNKTDPKLFTIYLTALFGILAGVGITISTTIYIIIGIFGIGIITGTMLQNHYPTFFRERIKEINDED